MVLERVFVDGASVSERIAQSSVSCKDVNRDVVVMALSDNVVVKEGVLKVPGTLYANFTPVFVHLNDNSSALVAIVECHKVIHGRGADTFRSNNGPGIGNRLEDSPLTTGMLHEQFCLILNYGNSLRVSVLSMPNSELESS